MTKKRVNFLLFCILLIILTILVNKNSMLVVSVSLIIFFIAELLLFATSNTDYQGKLKLEQSTSNLATGYLVFEGQNKLPVSQVIAEVTVKNRLTQAEKKYDLHFYPLKNKANRLKVNLTSAYCGAVDVELTAVTYVDLLGICKRRGKGQTSYQTVLVIPDVTEIAVDNLKAWRGQELAELVQNKKGFDPGEIYDFKTYEIGDVVKNIHWKLSAKEQELIVKELSEPADQSQFILLETLYDKEDRKQLPKIIDGLMTIYLSISQSLLNQSIAHSLVWYNEADNQLMVVPVYTVEDLRETMTNLLSVSLSTEGCGTLASFQQSEFALESDSIIYVAPYHQLLKVKEQGLEDHFISVTCVRSSSSIREDHGQLTHVLNANKLQEELLKIVL